LKFGYFVLIIFFIREILLAEFKTGSKSKKAERKSRFLMVVDSEPDSLVYLCSLLERFNYPSFSVATAQEAIETAQTAVPLLIIVSLNLKDMDGFHFIQTIKEHPKTADIPVIAIHTQEDLSVRKRLLDLGAVGCLYQPVSAEVLYRVVQVAIEKNPRAGLRVRTNQPVKVNDSRHDSLYGAYTLDLSEHGMFLRTVHPVSARSRLLLQLDIEGRMIAAEAEVLYNCKAGEEPYMEPGLGLKFTRIDPKDQERIRHFIMREVTQGIAGDNARGKDSR
jgi:CheY-like chemotaxis protein